MVKEKTHASSKDLIASFIASEPDINVPYGNLLEPDRCLSSETFSASSRSRENIRDIRAVARILALMMFLRSASSVARGTNFGVFALDPALNVTNGLRRQVSWNSTA